MNTTGASVVQHQQDLLQQPQQPATVTTNKDKRVVPIPIPLDREQLKLLLLRWNALKSAGIKETNHDELRELSRVLKVIEKSQQVFKIQCEKLNEVRKPSKKYDSKVDLLRAQMQSFKLLSRNLDIPASLQSVMLDSLSKDKNNNNNNVQDAKNLDLNLTVLNSQSFRQRERRADALSIRERAGISKQNSSVRGMAEVIIRNRISARLHELETLPSSICTINAKALELNPTDAISSHEDTLKLKALLELKSLRLLTKQKSMRQHIVYKLAADADDITKSISNRASNRRFKVQSAQELRLTEQLELQQRQERERKEREERMVYVKAVIRRSDNFAHTNKSRKDKRTAFNKSVMQAHSQIEKEESRRAERTAKQRLQALRANDEEAYIKLLDQTKDTRITHLLKQTNQFLDSLSQAVKVQQQDGIPLPEHDEYEVEEEEQAAGDEEDSEEKIDYYQIAHRIRESVTKQPSILVGGSLKEYQVKGLQWMVSLYNNNLNGILADEMGLGKTIQSISLITYLIETKRQPGPYLVIVPLSTLTNWTNEFEKWAPTVKKIVYKGSPNARKGHHALIRSGDFQVLLTTYEFIIKDRPILSKLRWTHMIIDEGHRMKNTNSKLSSTLTQYYFSRHRLILTGTPLQNNLPELWALLNFVLPKIFNSVKTFDDWFNTPFANTGGQEKMELNEEESLLIIRRLHKVLRPFLLRRLKKDVEKDLPDKVEKVVKCRMSALQSKLYDQMLKYNVLFIGENDKSSRGVKGLNNKIMQLRKICNHPFVFEEVENIINPTRTTNNDLWRVAGKFELLDRVLPKFHQTGHRVLMFFQMTQVMDIMEDYFRFKGLQYLRLDGSTKADDRSELLKLFNAPDSPYFAFLLSTRAGGLGLNLQTADTVIIYDTDWNPHQDLQAQDRAHRIGQTKEVRILRLITEDSVEEVILSRAHAKLDIDGKVIQAGKFDNKSTAEEQEAFLRSLIEAEERKRSQKEEDDEMDDEELNEILARSEEECEIFREMDEERNAASEFGKDKDKDRLFGEDELPEEYLQDIEQHLEPERNEVLGRGARERKVVYYDDGLTEQQWLEAVDKDVETLETAIARKRERMKNRQGRQSLDNDNEVDGGEEASSPAESREETPVIIGKRKRTRISVIKAENGIIEDGLDQPTDAGLEQPLIDEEEAARPVKRKARGSLKSSDSLSSDNRQTLNANAITIYNMVADSTDEDSRRRADIFMELPDKKLYPDYYGYISHPIALDVILKKVNTSKYTTLDQVKADFDLMFENARTYNEPESLVYHDADALSELVNQKYNELISSKLEDGIQESAPSSNTPRDGKKSRKSSSRTSLKITLRNTAPPPAED